MPVQATFDAPIQFDGAPALGIQELANSIRYRGPNAEQVALGFEQIENTFSQLIEALTSTVEGVFSELTVVTPDGEVIGWVGDRDGYSGGWFKNLYVGGSDPSTAPLVADSNGRVTLLLGDGDDQAYLAVLNASGSTVVWAGKTGTDYGLYAQNLWVGGTGPADAPFFSDGSTVTVGQNGRVFIRNTRGTAKGFLGIQAESGKVITAAANNGSGLIRLSVTAHGYETGDTVDATIPGVSSGGSWAITKITANTFDLIGSSFSGAYSGGGTVYRYYGGIWSETAAFGKTGFSDALFRVFADSSLRIGTAAGSRLEVSSSGALSLTDSTISISGGSGGVNYLVTISPTLVAIADLTNGRTTTMYGGSVAITSSGSDAAYGLNAATLTFGNASISIAVDSTLGPRLLTQATDGAVRLTLNGETGVADIVQLDIAGATVIDSTQSGVFFHLTASDLTLSTALAVAYGGSGASTAAGARTNFNVYSKSEVDALLAGKANVVHSHSTITITGTAGGGVAAHTHTGSVS